MADMWLMNGIVLFNFLYQISLIDFSKNNRIKINAQYPLNIKYLVLPEMFTIASFSTDVLEEEKNMVDLGM